MSLLEYSEIYLPKYHTAIDILNKHEKSHWVQEDVKLQTDVEQWKNGKINDDEKHLIKNILRLFTESDKAVASGYYDKLIPFFKNNDIRMMLGSFAARESIHQIVYALLNDTLGFGEEFYYEFLKWAEMKEKHEFMIENVDTSDVRNMALYLAKQTLIEGVNLFASFAMLVNFDRMGKLPGMVDAVRWSSNDENCFKGDVEILTEKGFQRFDELDKSVKVAQFDSETEEISFVTPVRYVENEYDGDMVNIVGTSPVGGVDIECTAEHDLLYWNNESRRYEKMKAKDFAHNATNEHRSFVCYVDRKFSTVYFTECDHTSSKHTGTVYCVTVPKGNIVIRHNDKVSVVGNCHIEGLAYLFRELLNERPDLVTDDFKKEIYDCAREVVRLEDAFIDICFADKHIEGMNKEETKQYIRYVVDKRLNQLGLKENYNVVNPIQWVEMLLGTIHAGFFEREVTEYSKGNLKGSYADGY